MITGEKTPSQMKQELATTLKQLNKRIDTYSVHYARGRAQNVKKILGAMNQLIGHRLVLKGLKQRLEKMKDISKNIKSEIKEAYDRAIHDLNAAESAINV